MSDTIPVVAECMTCRQDTWQVLSEDRLLCCTKCDCVRPCRGDEFPFVKEDK